MTVKRVYPAVAGGGSVRQFQSETWDPSNHAPRDRATPAAEQPGAAPAKRRPAGSDAAGDRSPSQMS
jgi:hypothetical protein